MRPELLVMGNYYDHLTRYLHYFSMNEILVLFSDDLFHDPSRELGYALRFLGLVDKHGLEAMEDCNQTPRVYRLGRYFLPQRVSRLLEKPLLGSPVERLGNLMEHRFGPISQEDRDFLREYYRSQNDKLFGLLNTRKDWD